MKKYKLAKLEWFSQYGDTQGQRRKTGEKVRLSISSTRWSHPSFSARTIRSIRPQYVRRVLLLLLPCNISRNQIFGNFTLQQLVAICPFSRTHHVFSVAHLFIATAFGINLLRVTQGTTSITPKINLTYSYQSVKTNCFKLLKPLFPTVCNILCLPVLTF